MYVVLIHNLCYGHLHSTKLNNYLCYLYHVLFLIILIFLDDCLYPYDMFFD